MAGNNLDLIVDIQISRDLPPLTSVDFNGVLFVTNDQVFSERYRQYSSVDDMVLDGFSSNSATYNAVRAFFQQENTKPSQITIGRRDATVATLTLAEADVVNSTDYVVTVQGTDFSFTSAADAEDDAPAAIALILNGLESLITADTAVSAEAAATITGLAAATALVLTEQATFDMTLALDVNVFAVAYTLESWTDALANINDAFSNYWAIGTYDHTVDGVLEIAASVNAGSKYYLVSNVASQNMDAPDTDHADDLLQKLADFNYDRTAFCYSATANSTFLEMAYLGDKITAVPGSTNWNLSPVKGVVADNLTLTQINNLEAKNGNYFTNYGGIDFVRSGKSVSGEWIDVIHGADNLKADMQIELVRVMATANNSGSKIPLTDKGVAILMASCDAVMQRYVSRGFIKNCVEEVDSLGNLTSRPGYTITAPLVSSMSANDRAARKSPDIQIIGDLAGAVNTSTVKINLFV